MLHVFLCKKLFLLYTILHLTFGDALFLLDKTFFYFEKDCVLVIVSQCSLGIVKKKSVVSEYRVV